MLPHTVIGPVILTVALYMALVAYAGSNVTATVTAKDKQYDSESGTSYELKYDYSFAGTSYKGSGTTSKNTWNELAPGSHITLKLLPPFPHLGQQILDGNQPWWSVTFMFGFGLVWTAFMLIPLNFAYIKPHKLANVMKSGKVCRGRIAQKSITGDDKDEYNLHYEYEPSPGLCIVEKASVSKEQYERAEIGEKVCIVYDPESPRTSLIHRYSDFQVI